MSSMYISFNLNAGSTIVTNQSDGIGTVSSADKGIQGNKDTSYPAFFVFPF